jgi:hypothetical protein
MKVYRYIALLLLFCFSAFLGHNLVPHHHHAEASLNPIASDCPIEHKDHHSHDHDEDGENRPADEHPTHCHAFNDVVFEKYNAPVVNSLSGYTLVMAASYTDLIPDPLIKIDFYRSQHLKFPLKTIELYSSRGLRGPPSVA